MPANGTGNGWDFIAGGGGALIDAAAQASCLGNPVGCLIDNLRGTSPSQEYKKLITSNGIDTTSGAYFAGNLIGNLLLAAAGGAVGAAKGAATTLSDMSAKAGGNIVYRALNSQDALTVANGEGIVAKTADGAWSLAEHLVRGSSRDSWANDPWISTTWDQSVAQGFNEAGSKLGVVAIDLDRVSSVTAEGWRIYPRLSGEAGLPYYYSIWQQEVSVFQRIPQEAIMGFVK